jgi:hypothetical protein
MKLTAFAAVRTCAVGLRYEGKKIGSNIYRENSSGVMGIDLGIFLLLWALRVRNRLIQAHGSVF